MKKKIVAIGTASLFVIGMTAATGCGHEGDNAETTAPQKQENTHMHQHNQTEQQGNHGMHQHMNMSSDDVSVADCPLWQEGEHMHSDYVCPMWHEEGESSEPGICAKCGMKLLPFSGLKAKHDEQNKK